MKPGIISIELIKKIMEKLTISAQSSVNIMKKTIILLSHLTRRLEEFQVEVTGIENLSKKISEEEMRRYFRQII